MPWVSTGSAGYDWEDIVGEERKRNKSDNRLRFPRRRWTSLTAVSWERERIGPNSQRDDPSPVTWSQARFPLPPRFRSIFGEEVRALERQ